MVIRIGINGFGRIGRVIFRKGFQDNDLEISAINDPAIDIEYICYLIKFDSTHGKFKKAVTFSANEITIDDVKVKVFSEKVPTNIPWDKAAVEYVVEASGMFTSLEKASGHLKSASVKRVIVTAPTIDVPMMILGVNEGQIKAEHNVISCSSSTLYCLAPIIKILQDNYGVTDGFITSIHAMTPSLKPLDGLCLRGKHWRDHRSIHQNIIPAATGACKALGEIIPQVRNKLMGLAFRVPIVNVSVLDISIRLNKSTTIQDIIKCVEAKSNSNMKNIIKISKDQEVSSDFLGDEHSCVFDVNSSLQLNSNFFKLICWYENEYSYSCRVVDSIKHFEYKLKSKISLDRLSALGKPVFEKLIPYFNKEYCTYNICSKPRLLVTASQETSFKYTQRETSYRRPLSLRDSGCNQSTKEQSNNCKNISKNLNDEIEISKPLMKEDRHSFFQSCIALSPTHFQCQNYLKTQEHLKEVKKEISKMVDMTEKLLQQSSQSQCEIKILDSSTMEYEQDKKDTIDKYVHSTDLCNSNKKKIMTSDCKSSTKKTYIDIFKAPRNGNHKIENKQTRESYSLEEFNAQFRPKSNSDKKVQTILDDKKSVVVIKDNKKFVSNVNMNEPVKILQIISDNNKISTDYSNKTHDVGDLHKVSEIQNISTFNIAKLKEENCENNIPYEKVDIHKNDSNTIIKDGISNINNVDKSVGNYVDKTSVNSIIELKKEELKKNKHISKKELQNKIIGGIIKKLSNDSTVESMGNPYVLNPDTTVSNGECYVDIYDKLDSESTTDSENSFQINEKKSQVIDIADLTSSLEDLGRLDKICRIIEISDELSDKLFSALEKDGNSKKKKWSLKDLCERIKLDEFCNNIFGLPSSKSIP